MIRYAGLVCTVSIALILGSSTGAQDARTFITHALTLEDVPKYSAEFEHREYVNPNAPKGGTLRLFAIGGFDTFNPFITKGDAAVGMGNIFYESLITETQDDSLTGYGLIAGQIEVAHDLSFAVYHLRDGAHFNDGSPITAHDVVFSFNILKEKGLPFYRYYYGNVSEAVALDSQRVRFSFSGPPNRELPQIIGQLPILSKEYWEEREFDKTTLEPPLASGPYKIVEFEPGRFVVFERDENYWGADLPINRGMYNFYRIRYDYVRDDDVSVEAFKSGEYDFRAEGSSKKWATSYDFPALHEGLVKKEMLRHYRATGMPSFVFNLRKPKFQDKRVRKAIGLCFDFEWSNKNLFYGQYTRSRSFYDNSDLASEGLPSNAELELLEPHRGDIPDEVFSEVYKVPVTDGTGNIRRQLQEAFSLLSEAGWQVENNQLVHTESGEVMEIEFLLQSPDFERIVSPFLDNLGRLGIQGSIRTVEPAQYENRRNEFDYDMITVVFGQSRSPGNEQRDYWGSAAADVPGSRNFAGIKDPAIDVLVENVVEAKTREELKVATRALDRALQWNYFVIPTWHINSDRVIWWDKFGIPDVKPMYGVGLLSWWVDPEKNERVEAYRN
ncbi:MAG: extracellular solute-binding protein [Gammaproteobacteria bacterium]|nr:extracellular solute-binding protein [Gammaproteobacteria bacterium]